MPQINYEYLRKLKPINGNSEGFDNPLSRASTDARTIKSLGFSGSNSGNVSDFDNPDSDLSTGTASIIQNMRMQREAKIKSDAMPESEKLFLIEMRRRKAKEDAKNYMDMRKIEQEDDLINLKKMELQQTMAETLADREEKERTKAEEATKSFNDGYATFLEKTGSFDSPEARQAYAKQREFTSPDSMALPQQQETAVQSQVQDGLGVTPKKDMTIGEFRYGKKKDEDQELRKSNLKLQEDTGYIFKPEEESLSEADKRKILLSKKKESGGNNMKDFQGKAGIYADRMQESNKILDQLETEGYNRAGLSNSLVSGATNAIPFGIGEALKPEQLKKYEQAQRDFLNAVLRQESGAVISEDEFENGKAQYFPVVGDTKEVIEQKRRNRITAYNGIRRASGMSENNTASNQQTQQNNNGSGITREQAIAELKRRGRIQ